MAVHEDPLLDLDPQAVSRVRAALAAAAREHGVRMLWAVESGSRAWGFPSPDSDFDARFIYAHPETGYLTPWLPRDVIEYEPGPVLDVSGWDLRKALDLLVRGNATVLEWLRSPLVYGGDAHVRGQLLDLAGQIGEPESWARHYAHVAQQQWQRCGAERGGAVRLKGVFYAVRPAAVLHWMRVHPGPRVPPMRLSELFEQAPPPPDVAEAVDELLVIKSRTREMGEGGVPTPVARYVTEIAYDQRYRGAVQRRVPVGIAREAAAEVFRSVIRAGA